jgi:hypothetical protein
MDTVVFSTAGDGLWSNVSKDVEVINMQLGYVSDEGDFGELCVFFDTASWDVDVDGLIYTDSGFYADLQQYIKQQGLVVDLCYSEQGMQGNNYVSLDVGQEFLDSWARKFGVDSLVV